MHLRSLVLASSILALPVAAQGVAYSAAPSTRATAVLTLNPPRGTTGATPLTVKIDYGQPHARGRDVPAELASDNTVWRTGANSSTTLTTDADLTIGGLAVPKGSYSLYSIRQGTKYFLIINTNTGQWGTEYDQTKDLGRVELRSRTTAEVTESLSIALVPPAQGPARGTLTIAWGKLHLSTDWALR
jgi:hypothetical protein